jgi:uncharacterized SAM-binding protein YcdF (DUF218 family)
MFFILSKTAATLLLPSNFLLILGCIGLALMATRFKRGGMRLAVVSLALLPVLGFSPLDAWLSNKLASRFPQWDSSHGAPNGIIVLGGGISAALSRDFGDTVLNLDSGRVVAIAKLARAYPNARFVYSGGDASLQGGGPAEGNYLYPLLDSFGVPRERVILEPRSRNTFENATFTKELVRPKPGERWLLVTSAQHMPRAMGVFQHIGFPVEAYPVAWHTRKRVSLYPSETFSKGLARLDFVTREWIGLVTYRIAGLTGELLPGPESAQ